MEEREFLSLLDAATIGTKWRITDVSYTFAPEEPLGKVLPPGSLRGVTILHTTDVGVAAIGTQYRQLIISRQSLGKWLVALERRVITSNTPATLLSVHHLVRKETFGRNYNMQSAAGRVTTYIRHSAR